MELKNILKVIIKYFIILCSFKILVLAVIILLQIEQELVRKISYKKSPVYFCGSFKTLKTYRPLCPTTLNCGCKIHAIFAQQTQVCQVLLILTLKLCCRLNNRLIPL